MRTVIMAVMCVSTLAFGMAVCGPVFAGPIENASEFQDEVIQRSEEASMNEPGAGSGSISWGDDSIAAPADSVNEETDQ